jgi:hypothetical protein
MNVEKSMNVALPEHPSKHKNRFSPLRLGENLFHRVPYFFFR